MDGSFAGKTVRFHITPVHAEGQRHRQHVRGELRPHDPVHSERVVEQEQHRDVEDQPAHNTEEECLATAFMRL